MVHMTEETCSRCPNKLASSNRHPDRLCGACQHDLASYKDRRRSPALREWIAAGKPRITRPAGETGVTAHADLTPPPITSLASWPVDLLVAATRELLRRRVVDEVTKLALG